MKQLNQDDFRKKIGELWWPYLEEFFASETAYEIYQTLKNDAKKEIISPKSSETFKFLTHTRPDSIKVVAIGLDSYPGKYFNGELHATGIPFDCSNSPNDKLQPSLIEFWNGLSAEFNDELPKQKDLTFLLHQGLFLGNRGITCKLYKTGSHIPMWDKFWEVFFKNFVSQRPDIPIIFMGKEALQLNRFVTFNKVFELDHPSFAARSGVTWDTKKVFTQCNNIIKGNNGKDFMIKYHYKEYKEWVESCPF